MNRSPLRSQMAGQSSLVLRGRFKNGERRRVGGLMSGMNGTRYGFGKVATLDDIFWILWL